MNRTLPGATTPCQSGPESDGNKGILCSPQSSSITGILPSDCLVSYPEHSMVESYTSTEMQLVYSAALANWVIIGVCIRSCNMRLIMHGWYWLSFLKTLLCRLTHLNIIGVCFFLLSKKLFLL